MQRGTPPSEATLKYNNQPHLVKFQDEDEGLSQYFIAVEQKLMLECSTLSAALFFGMVAHYIFNLEYHSKVKGVWLFLQDKVFQLPSSDKGGKHSPSCIAHITGISRVHTKLCESAMECNEQLEQCSQDDRLKAKQVHGLQSTTLTVLLRPRVLFLCWYPQCITVIISTLSFRPTH